MDRIFGMYFDGVFVMAIRKLESMLASMFILFLTSCNKLQPVAPVLSQSEINRKVDSILSIRIPEIVAEGNSDLQYRLKIELKPRIDSIRQARLRTDAKQP